MISELGGYINSVRKVFKRMTGAYPGSGETPLSEAEFAKLYRPIESFTNYLPWLDYDPQTQTLTIPIMFFTLLLFLPGSLLADFIPELPTSLDEIGADQETGGFSSVDIVTSGLDAFSDCVDYCITGLSIRLYIGLPIKIYLSPLIEHNTADFVVQSYSDLGGGENDDRYGDPWKEWGSVVGKASLAITKPAAKLMGSDEGLGGGKTRVAAYSKHQNLDFKEADVIGSPYILLTILLDKEGEIKKKEAGCEVNGCLEKEPGAIGEALQAEIADNESTVSEGEPGWYEKSPEELASDAKDDLVNKVGTYTQKMQTCRNSLRCVLDTLGGDTFSRIFSMMDAAESVIESVRKIQDVTEKIKTIVDAFSAIAAPIQGEFRMERILCESQYQPFMPYYLSGLDAAFWRSGLIGIPPVDPHMTSTILNPFSGDRIGTDTQLWGHIYPRSGFVDNPHDAKSGAVAAVRAMNIVSEMDRTRMRWLETGFDTENAQWQMIYPLESSQCHADIAKTTDGTNIVGDFMYPGEERRYAWNYWRKYKCDTNEKGSRLIKISLPEICI
ncbi:MAG: TraU family protein [Gammaproteobacteria bacterium]|nr:TraU family protein [Gammaproteobacteria bacterium]